MKISFCNTKIVFLFQFEDGKTKFNREVVVKRRIEKKNARVELLNFKQVDITQNSF